MKPLLIVANFKSNMTKPEVISWLQVISKFKVQISKFKNKRIIVCPPFTLLQMFKDLINEQKLPIELGAQNISHFAQGPYTGEINGAQIKDFANYVLVGHSERRGSFGEDESVIEEKIKMSQDYNLIPILFLQNENIPVPKGVEIVVYEPPEAISSVSGGVADNPKDVSDVVSKIRQKSEFKYVLYGGSVDSSNVSKFTSLPNVDGVVPGKASLDASEFFKIVFNA